MNYWMEEFIREQERECLAEHKKLNIPDVINCKDCNDKQITREADGGILICHCFDKD